MGKLIIRFYPGYEEPDYTKWPFEEMTAEEYGQRKIVGEFDGKTYHVEEVENDPMDAPKPNPSNTLNLCPHDIHWYDEGEVITFPKSGKTVRLKEVNQPSIYGWAKVKVYENPTIVGGEVRPDDYVYFLVSGLALEACQKQWSGSMFLSPDTGTGAVRDEKGQIIGTKNWVVSQKFQEK